MRSKDDSDSPVHRLIIYLQDFDGLPLWRPSFTVSCIMVPEVHHARRHDQTTETCAAWWLTEKARCLVRRRIYCTKYFIIYLSFCLFVLWGVNNPPVTHVFKCNDRNRSTRCRLRRSVGRTIGRVHTDSRLVVNHCAVAQSPNGNSRGTWYDTA